MKKKRALIYAKPTLENVSFFNARHWATMSQDMYKALCKDEIFDARILVNEYQASFFSKELRHKLIVMSMAEVMSLPGGFKSDIFANNASKFSRFAPEFSRVLQEAIGNWSFDIAICFADKGLPLKAAYPDVPVVSVVESYFSRAPYPNLWNIDVHGIDDLDTMNTCRAEIVDRDPGRDAHAAIAEIKDCYRTALRLPHSEQEKGHDILLPLQHQEVSAVELYARYPNQNELLYDVLSSAGSKFSVAVTEHPQYPELTKAFHLFLESNFKAYSYDASAFRVEGASQSLLSTSSVCFCQTSTVGAQAALIWDKPVYMLSKRNRITPFSVGDTTSFFANPRTELTGQEVQDRERLLHFALSRLAYTRKDLMNPDFLPQVMLSFIENGANFDTYDKITRPSDPIEMHVAHARQAKPNALNRRKAEQITHLSTMPIALVDLYAPMAKEADKPVRTSALSKIWK